MHGLCLWGLETLSIIFLMCEQAPPKFHRKISWEQISVVGQCTVRFTLLRQSNFDRRVHLKLFGTVLF